MDIENVKTLIKDILEKKFEVRSGKVSSKFTNEIKKDYRYTDLVLFFLEYYIDKGMGIKSIIKDFDLCASYSSLRNLIKFMGIELHKPNEINDFLRERRSINAKILSRKKEGAFSTKAQEKIKIKNSLKRGIQGYYFNNSKNKYVWIRSSWEYIYAKWLNDNGKNWDTEVNSYELANTTYRPDFFIYDENWDLEYIVEVKGYWKDKLYKCYELSRLIDVPIKTVLNINQYTQNLNKDIREWKKLRKLELSE